MFSINLSFHFVFFFFHLSQSCLAGANIIKKKQQGIFVLSLVLFFRLAFVCFLGD